MPNSNLLHGIRNLLGGPRSQRQTSDYIPLSNVEPNSQSSGVEASLGGLYTHTSSNDSGYAENAGEVESYTGGVPNNARDAFNTRTWKR